MYFDKEAKQAHFAVRSIWIFDWPRVAASQKMIQYNKTPALQAIIHLFGEGGAEMFKKSAVDLNSAFYP